MAKGSDVALWKSMVDKVRNAIVTT
jgi:hypothetical protein